MEWNKEEILIKTSDGKEPQGCSSYNQENGYCNNTNKPCDMCYVNVKF